MIKIIKAVIFDMDGVIIDSEPVYRIASKNVVSRYGGIYDESISDKEMGLSIKESSRVVVNETGIKVDPDVFAKEYISEYLKLTEDMLKPNSGIERLLKFCSENYLTALASSTVIEIVNTLMKRFGFKKYFKYMIGGDQVENSKPDPTIYIEAGKNLGVNPDECIVIEDSLNGVKSAISAEMAPLVLKHSLNEKTIFPDTVRVFSSIEDIQDYLKSISGKK